MQSKRRHDHVDQFVPGDSQRSIQPRRHRCSLNPITNVTYSFDRQRRNRISKQRYSRQHRRNLKRTGLTDRLTRPVIAHHPRRNCQRIRWVHSTLREQTHRAPNQDRPTINRPATINATGTDRNPTPTTTRTQPNNSTTVVNTSRNRITPRINNRRNTRTKLRRNNTQQRQRARHQRGHINRSITTMPSPSITKLATLRTSNSTRQR